MRWDNLFDDLEGQLEQELSAEEVDLYAEQERLRLGRLSLRERFVSLQASDGPPGPREGIRLALATGETVLVRPTSLGRDWLLAELLDEAPRRVQCIIAFSGISSILLSSGQVAASLGQAAGEASDHVHSAGQFSSAERSMPAEQSLSARLGLSFVLRDLCRRRTTVEVRTVSATHNGTIDRVGRDHFDLAEHERGMARRASAVTQHRLIPLERLVLVLMHGA